VATLAARVVVGHAKTRKESDLWVKQACRLLDQNLSRQEATGQAVARSLDMGYESFRKKFVHHTGVSPGRYRELRRIEKAQQILQSKRMTNKELADMLGFCDEGHFSKAFRKAAGMSPRAFVKSMQDRPAASPGG
jgi:AraC-like DNA-binding protein